MSNRVLGLIPARSGSKGLPGKNLKKIEGRTLIEWAVDVARRSGAVDSILVSSDGDEILKEARRLGALVSERPAQLAGDEAAMIDVVRHECRSRRDYEIVVLLQPTSPLRLPSELAACIRALEDHPSSPSAVSLVPLEHPLEWVFGLAEDNSLMPLQAAPEPVTRRQDARRYYRLSGAVYAARVAHVLAGGGLLDSGALGVVSSWPSGIDIDTEADLLFAQLVAGRGDPW